VSGWIQPIVIFPPEDPAAPVLVELAPLMLELHASSRLPPPTTAALAPNARSTPRRLRNPGPSYPSVVPFAPRKGFVLSGCAVWSLIAIDLL
jgi:hypothetical protein